MTGRLFLIPTPLGGGEADPAFCLPEGTLSAVRGLRDFVVENEKSAWRFLGAVMPREVLPSLSLRILDEHSRPEDIPALAAPLRAGRDMGLMSEAGCPGIADPGAPLVSAAHAAGAEVRPLTGPSSIILALMASGMNGQAFRFHGYLPRDRQERRKSLRALEREALSTGSTQIFIEAPYRSAHMVEDMAAVLSPGTPVCVAAALDTPGQRIIRRKAGDLAELTPGLNKVPAVFLIGRP